MCFSTSEKCFLVSANHTNSPGQSRPLESQVKDAMTLAHSTKDKKGRRKRPQKHRLIRTEVPSIITERPGEGAKEIFIGNELGLTGYSLKMFSVH
jgi:hypothetical protein